MFTLHFISFYNIVLVACLACIKFFFHYVQMNPCGKVQLVIANVPGNLPIPFISKNPNDIPTWNRKVDEYIDGVFDFA